MTEPTKDSVPTRGIKDYAGLSARGFAMGAADVVPGVSGGTMAFILGIYEELLNSIRSLLHPDILRQVGRFDLKGLYRDLPWRFLAAVGFGIRVAVVSLAKILETQLNEHPALVWSFFFGLVLASVLTVSTKVGRWNGRTAFGAIVGAVIAYLIVGMVPAQTPDAPWFLFVSGFIAICAMILPGISGSFILVLMGKYQSILAAVNDRDLVTIGIVGAGATVGILTFAQVLGWLFRKDHDLTVAILVGFMMGSLRKIWPWKETLRTITDRHGELVPVEQINQLPASWTSEVTYGLILAIVGFTLVFLMDRLSGPVAEKG
jgi:putative membrane protein